METSHFVRLFLPYSALACSKRAKVAEVWDLSRGGGGEGAWMPTFLRPFND